MGVLTKRLEAALNASSTSPVDSLAATGLRLRRGTLAEDDRTLADAWLCLAEVRWLGGSRDAAIQLLGLAKRCGATDRDLKRYPELVAVRKRPDYPLVSSP